MNGGPERPRDPVEAAAEDPGGSRLDTNYGMEMTVLSSFPPETGAHVSKPLAIMGLVVSGLIVVLFLADLIAGFPFRRVSVFLDVAFVVGGLLVAYLSWAIMPPSGGPKGTEPAAAR